MYEKKARIFIKTYGCTMNQHETEMIKGILSEDSHEFTNSENDADLIMVNTCMVKTPTENKVLRYISDVNRKYPEKRFLITGCLPEVVPERVIKVIPKASLLGTSALQEVSSVVKETLKGHRVIRINQEKAAKLGMPVKRLNRFIGIIPISEGCLGSCTYCCVRLAKGSLFSYPLSEIKNEALRNIKDGCKEIWLTAQDTAAYTHENSKLPDLLRTLIGLDANF
ncbi:MAG: tRNA (N(6)-L-threonylcarbamoyladenosine(37)-C(2))-methylthiotransferase, partial [Candidatus Helarchaeales archaeon]